MPDPSSLPLRPIPSFNPFRLISSTTLIPFDNSVTPPILPVIRLTFALPPGTSLNLDPGVGDHIKLKFPAALKPRSYSITSDPSLIGSFDLTVKLYPGGAASNALAALAPGDSCSICGPVPPRPFRFRRLRGKVVYALVQGLGITEGLPVARAELQKGDAENITLVHGNRYGKDVLFREETVALRDRYGDVFRVVRLFSGEDVPGGRRGRIDGPFLKGMVGARDGRKHDWRFLVVGSKKFIAAVWKELGRLGFGKRRHSLLEMGAWERKTAAK